MNSFFYMREKYSLSFLVKKYDYRNKCKLLFVTLTLNNLIMWAEHQWKNISSKEYQNSGHMEFARRGRNHKGGGANNILANFPRNCRNTILGASTGIKVSAKLVQLFLFSVIIAVQSLIHTSQN